jgi:hypothetical protein
MRNVVGAATVVAVLGVVAVGRTARGEHDAELAGAPIEHVVPVVPHALAPMPYGAEMLPASATRPYVIVPRSGFLTSADPSFHWGYRTSTYGDYSRFNYKNTGPFPGLVRPYVWFPCPHHGSGSCHSCR